ncbi:MAG: hypothetical protein NTY61_03425 [Candidatus Parcubacteria bacterium]|nr:hypothetical protein [Candidatus Parcubacteria bacterium]
MTKIYIICSVRNGDPELQKRILQRAQELEGSGYLVRVPFRNTDQNDPVGINITQEHELQDILWADRVIAFWNPLSEGSWYDLAQVRMEQCFRNLGIDFFDPETMALLPYHRVPRSPLLRPERDLLSYRDLTLRWIMDPSDLTRVEKTCLWSLAQARIILHHSTAHRFPDFKIAISNIAELKPRPIKSYTNVAICTHYGWTAPLTADEFQHRFETINH